MGDSEYERSLGALLTDLEAGGGQPIVFALHLVCPRVSYLDRGKSAVSLPYMARAEIVRLATAVTKTWTRQRKAEQRDANARDRRDDAMLNRKVMSQKEAAAQVIEAAYMKVSENGTLPANARQIYYAARPSMLKLTGKTVISQDYFSQTLVPDFMSDNEDICAGWDVCFDDRGHFEEPHNGARIGLGTLSVREYLKGAHALGIKDAGFKNVTIDTSGADARFGAILFIEKEGFRDLFKSVQLAERYDIGIMSSKGVSVTAARQLADHICHEHDIPLLTLHDFDVAGFTIGNIGKDTRRYTWKNSIDIFNIGLRLDDVLEMDGVDLDAMAERCKVEGDKRRDDEATDDEIEDFLASKREKLEASEATEDEINFLLGEGEFEDDGTRRIELNALTSRQLVDLVEQRLEQRGIKKILPDADSLADAFRAYARAPAIKEAIERAIESMPANTIDVPADLEDQVRDYLEENPECPWEGAIAEIVKNGEDEED